MDTKVDDRTSNGSRSPRINVLIVDDSALMRQAMASLLSTDDCIRVTTAPDPIIAMRKMKRTRPDVIVLDLEMPRMDGLTFLRKIMWEDPIPVLVCSDHTSKGSGLEIRALEEGAVDIIAKPQVGVRHFLEKSAERLLAAVRGAAQARVTRPACFQNYARTKPDSTRPKAKEMRLPSAGRSQASWDKIVVIGASTGGTEAVKQVLIGMPPDAPPIVIVQHMPEKFTGSYAKSLDRVCAIRVKEATSGDRLTAGLALIVPGDQHAFIVCRAGKYKIELGGAPPVSGHRPSVDVLFSSAARAAGPNAVGVIMTGMGVDGARGLCEMKEAGSPTIAQDKATAVVFGMPKEAIALGAVDVVLPLDQISKAILELAASDNSTRQRDKQSPRANVQGRPTLTPQMDVLKRREPPS